MLFYCYLCNQSLKILACLKKRVCTSCKVLKLDGLFIKCRCGPGVFFKTCIKCRDSNKKYRDKVRALKVIVVDDDTVLSVSSSTSPDDYFVNSPPPPGSGLVRFQTGLGSVSFD